MKIITRYDVFIAIIVLIAAMVSYVTIGLNASDDLPSAVEINVDGKLYGRYELNEVTSPEIVRINTKFGKNVLQITKDGAQMLESSCSDKIDVNCGKITSSGQIIICIPNRVTVKLIGGKENKVDRVTY